VLALEELIDAEHTGSLEDRICARLKKPSA
jgi:hypothetical protein